jgi:6-pyruvoyltetrahydropterin/6-carboxytetrahydropterin synthase
MSLLPLPKSLVHCARFLDVDAAHRLVEHRGKCAHLHGHRYRIEIVCEGTIDGLGVVVDFGEIKARVGAWLDEHWDHAAILNRSDAALVKLCRDSGWHLYVLDCNPTAENLAAHLLDVARRELSHVSGLRVAMIRIWETPNCYAEAK